jgi:hypothetical protein
MFFNSRFLRPLFRRRKEVIPDLGQVGELGFHLPGIIHAKFCAKLVPTLDLHSLSVSGGQRTAGIGIHFVIRNSAPRIRSLFSLVRKGFVNQHDRDIVLDLVDQATGLADQPVPGPVQDNVALALGARQYV